MLCPARHVRGTTPYNLKVACDDDARPAATSHGSTVPIHATPRPSTTRSSALDSASMSLTSTCTHLTIPIAQGLRYRGSVQLVLSIMLAHNG